MVAMGSLWYFAVSFAAQAAPFPEHPGSSPQHWTTLSILSGIVITVLLWVIAAFLRKRLFGIIQQSVVVRAIFYFGEAGLAIALSLVASNLDIFKKSTYVPTPTYQPDWHVLVWACIWAMIAAIYCAVKFVSILTKEREVATSAKLANDLENAETASGLVIRQRDLLARITSFAHRMVRIKIERLSKLKPADPVTVDQFIEELNPSIQIQSMVKLIHEFFRHGDVVDGGLRLAIWAKAPSESDRDARLSILYCWDGEKDGCFTNRSADRMKLLDPLGTTSEIVKCYHSQPRTIKIISDCIEASNKQQFEFFYPEQKAKVRSMLVYKHVFTQDTQPFPVVLLLVSSNPNQFPQEDEERFK